MSRAKFGQDLGTTQTHSGSAGTSSLIQQKSVHVSLPLLFLLPFTLSPFSSLPSPPSLNLIFSNSLSLYVFDQLSIYAWARTCPRTTLSGAVHPELCLCFPFTLAARGSRTGQGDARVYCCFGCLEAGRGRGWLWSCCVAWVPGSGFQSQSIMLSVLSFIRNCSISRRFSRSREIAVVFLKVSDLEGRAAILLRTFGDISGGPSGRS